jgi:hypothetical protein
MGENGLAASPVLVYGVVLFMAALLRLVPDRRIERVMASTAN